MLVDCLPHLVTPGSGRLVDLLSIVPAGAVAGRDNDQA
jgi:hypothetical protein